MQRLRARELLDGLGALARVGQEHPLDAERARGRAIGRLVGARGARRREGHRNDAGEEPPQLHDVPQIEVTSFTHVPSHATLQQ